MSARSAVHSNGVDPATGQEDDEEEVDAFGRIVPKETRRRSRSRSRSRSHSPERDDSDFRRRRNTDNEDSRRRRSRSPDRQRQRDAGRERDKVDRRSVGVRHEERRRDDHRPPPSAPILNIAPRNFHRPPPTHHQPFPPPHAYPPYPPHSYPPVHLTFPTQPSLLSHSVPLLSLHEWMAANGVQMMSADVERRYGDYRDEAINAPKRAFFDAHKQDEWMTHQYGYSASATQLAQRQQHKQTLRQHWLTDAQNTDSTHLHLLDDISSAFTTASSSSSAVVDNTVVFPPFPYRVNRSSLVSFVSSLPGFRLLSVAASTAKNHGNRMAFLVMSSPATCATAIEQCKGYRVDNWEVRVRGSVREVARRDVTALVREERKVQDDVKRAHALIGRLDDESGLAPFSSPSVEGEGGDADMRRLNTCLSYLRWVHSYCFYCAREYRDVESLINACGMTHRRRADFSGGGASDIDREEVERIERRVEERTRGEGGWVDEERRKHDRVKDALLRRFIEQKAESKWRCTMCNKLFKGEEYVLKHLINKHEAEVEQAEARLPDEYMWREYVADQYAPVEEKDKQSAGGGGSGMPLLFRPGQPLNALTTMPFVPGLHNTAMVDAQQPLSLLSPSSAAVVSLPTISIAPLSLVAPSPPITAPPAVSGRRGLTSYADLDVPDVAPLLPSHGLLLTPADKAAVHYGSKGKWVPKGKKGKDDAASENRKGVETVEETKEADGASAPTSVS